MKTITPKNGDQPRPIGKYGSVSEAARCISADAPELVAMVTALESAIYRMTENWERIDSETGPAPGCRLGDMECSMRRGYCPEIVGAIAALAAFKAVMGERDKHTATG